MTQFALARRERFLIGCYQRSGVMSCRPGHRSTCRKPSRTHMCASTSASLGSIVSREVGEEESRGLDLFLQAIQFSSMKFICCFSARLRPVGLTTTPT